MSSAPAATQALCQQCSAPLSVEQGTHFVECQFCGATNVLDKSQSVFHYAVRETVRPHDAEAMLRRWMGGNSTVKDLDKKAVIESPAFELFPMWLVRVKRQSQEEVFLEPAAAISISELKSLRLPAADLEPYESSFDEHATTATVPYRAMLQWLADDYNVQMRDISEVAIVHLPIYIFKYRFDDERFTAVVDAATGEVFSNIFPSKWEVPYQLLGGLGCLAYFLLALAPAGGLLMGDEIGLGTGIAVYLVLSIVIAIPIVVAAIIISAKV
jgi:hypothetical protein